MQGFKSIILERKGENDGFADRFGKVIPNGSFIFIEGKEGTGKSIFCQRFCFSLLKSDNTCSYVSTQFTIKSFLRQTASVGYDIRKYLMSGKFFFISTEVTLAETLPRQTFLEGLLNCRKLFEPDIIFIDSLSTLLKESLNQGNLTELTNFFNRLTGSGKIIFCTANPLEWTDEIHNTFRMITNIHFRTSRETAPGIGIVYNIYLEKFNGARFKYEPVTRFSVRPGTGLTIESSGVAF
jgi:archaeal flagellar protein FlaH